MATSSEQSIEGDLPTSGGCGAKQVISKPVKEKKHHLQGGYECIFVKDPPEVLQTECPICLCVLKEPYLIDCCGNSFCKTCIEPIKSDNKPCPLCNVQFTTIMPDKRLQRTLNELQVYCCHKEAGCEWVEELGSLPQYLNLNPQEESGRLLGCQLVSMRCEFCNDYIQRKVLNEHEESLCSQRPFSCEYCNGYKSFFEDVTTNHWPVCPSHPVPCPNQCGMSPKLESLDDHTENNCPLQVIDCAYKYAGCQERLARKDMPDHITQSLAFHMSLQAASHQQELKKLTGRMSELETQLGEATVKLKELEAKNYLLQETLDQECKNRVATVGLELKQAHELRLRGHLGNLRGEIKKAQSETKLEVTKIIESKVASLHNHVGLVPISFTMPGFQGKRSLNTLWYSPSFYTHPHGYKMCLRVDANGRSNNGHVSVGLHMMQGEYDKFLKWPFRGDITIQLINQMGNGHYIKVIDVTDCAGEFFNRILSGERSPHEWGFQEFISHTNLLPSYLKDDCLKLCIKEVKLNC